MALKVKLIQPGNRVPADAMDLLVRFAQHRNLCDECTAAIKTGSGNYCVTGAELFREMLRNPDIEYTPEPPPGS